MKNRKIINYNRIRQSNREYFSNLSKDVFDREVEEFPEKIKELIELCLLDKKKIN